MTIPAKIIGNYNEVKQKNVVFSNNFNNLVDTPTVRNMLKVLPVEFDIDEERKKDGK